MKKLSNIIILVLYIISYLPAHALTKGELAHALKALDLDIPIRVLLDEKNGSQVDWTLAAPSPFIIFAPHEKTRTVFQASKLSVTYVKGFFSINGRKVEAKHFFVIPVKGPIAFQGNAFDGVFAITQSDGKAYLVNHISLEDYVLSVLPYESWPGWPDEAQKALCIAVRSYGIAKVLEQRALHEKRGRAVPYDIKNTNAHQNYRGCLKSAPYRKYVEETRGVVLAHNNKPILAMFDICCGGIVPAHKKGIHFSKAPYLERSYPCYFCKDYKLYRWQRSYGFDKLEKQLKKEFPRLGMLKDIKIASHDAAGVAQEIKFKGVRDWYSLTASKFRSPFIKDIPSLCFNFKRHGRSITIDGKGHGHHMGLCQRGSYQMVLKGWDYKNILKFYYPNTTFMRLKRK